jgi:hypothetical protein
MKKILSKIFKLKKRSGAASTERGCFNCSYSDKSFDEEPCCYCDKNSEWEPKS